MPEAPDVMTTTMSDIPGYKITQVLGAIFANSWHLPPAAPFSNSTGMGFFISFI